MTCPQSDDSTPSGPPFLLRCCWWGAAIRAGCLASSRYSRDPLLGWDPQFEKHWSRAFSEGEPQRWTQSVGWDPAAVRGKPFHPGNAAWGEPLIYACGRGQGTESEDLTVKCMQPFYDFWVNTQRSGVESTVWETLRQLLEPSLVTVHLCCWVRERVSLEPKNGPAAGSVLGSLSFSSPRPPNPCRLASCRSSQSAERVRLPAGWLGVRVCHLGLPSEPRSTGPCCVQGVSLSSATRGESTGRSVAADRWLVLPQPSAHT